MGLRRYPHRGSDRIGCKVERVGQGVWTSSRAARMTPLTQTAQFKRYMIARGREIYTQDSRLCVCGKQALRVWKNIGYCKEHTPTSV